MAVIKSFKDPCFIDSTGIGSGIGINRTKWFKDPAQFITDEKQSTQFGFFVESQIGDKITIEAEKIIFYSYKVKINIYNNEHSAQEDNCNDQKNYNFSQCVDEQIFKEFVPVYGCVPNWLSLRNPCDKVIPFPENFMESYVVRYNYLQQTAAEMKCKNPCLRQIILCYISLETSRGT